jgi:hypothetical protein
MSDVPRWKPRQQRPRPVFAGRACRAWQFPAADRPQVLIAGWRESVIVVMLEIATGPYCAPSAAILTVEFTIRAPYGAVPQVSWPDAIVVDEDPSHTIVTV